MKNVIKFTYIKKLVFINFYSETISNFIFKMSILKCILFAVNKSGHTQAFRAVLYISGNSTAEEESWDTNFISFLVYRRFL